MRPRPRVLLPQLQRPGQVSRLRERGFLRGPPVRPGEPVLELPHGRGAAAVLHQNRSRVRPAAGLHRRRAVPHRLRVRGDLLRVALLAALRPGLSQAVATPSGEGGRSSAPSPPRPNSTTTVPGCHRRRRVRAARSSLTRPEPPRPGEPKRSAARPARRRRSGARRRTARPRDRPWDRAGSVAPRAPRRHAGAAAGRAGGAPAAPQPRRRRGCTSSDHTATPATSGSGSPAPRRRGRTPPGCGQRCGRRSRRSRGRCSAAGTRCAPPGRGTSGRGS